MSNVIISPVTSCPNCFVRAPKPPCLPDCDRDAIFALFKSDLEAIQIWKEKGRQLWYWYWKSPSKNAHWDKAVVDGKVLGTVHWNVRRDGIRNLHDIVVVSETRGSGLGRKLVEHVGLPIILKTDSCSIANGFYQHLGFTLYMTSESQNGQKKMNHYRLGFEEEQS
jgi:GNAT superfamily N-acetyltransferase